MPHNMMSDQTFTIYQSTRSLFVFLLLFLLTGSPVDLSRIKDKYMLRNLKH